MSATESHKILTPGKARQGALGRPVLIVLVVSLSMVLAVWAIMELWGQSMALDTSEGAPASTATETVNPGVKAP